MDAEMDERRQGTAGQLPRLLSIAARRDHRASRAHDAPRSAGGGRARDRIVFLLTRLSPVSGCDGTHGWSHDDWHGTLRLKKNEPRQSESRPAAVKAAA